MNNVNAKKEYELRIDLEHTQYFLGYADTVERGLGSSAWDALDDLDFHSDVDCEELTQALKDYQGSNNDCIEYDFRIELDAEGNIKDCSVDVSACLAAHIRPEAIIKTDTFDDNIIYITTWSTIDRDERLDQRIIDAIDAEIENSEYYFHASLVEV